MCTSSLAFRLTLLLYMALLYLGTTHQLAAAEPTPDEDKALLASLGLRLDFDTNIYDTSARETESWIGVVTPALLLTTSPGQRRLALAYKGEYGYFFEDSADNYADHLLSGAGRFRLGSRSRFELAVATEKGHWDRGSDQTDGFGPGSPEFPVEPDEFDRGTWEGKLRYGADGNRGRMTFRIGGSQIDYTNNRERTQFFDFETIYGGAGMSVLIRQRTALVFDAVYTEYRYDTDRPELSSRDSEDWRYLLGITWEATAKTSGAVRLGLQQRGFADPSLPDTSNPTWQVDVRWSPREHSHFDFVTARINQESFAEGAFIDSVTVSLGWTHKWNRRGWESVLRLGRSDLEFIDAARDQVTEDLYFGVRYPQSRLITWEAGYSWRSRDSNLSRLVYEGNMFTIGLNIAN